MAYTLTAISLILLAVVGLAVLFLAGTEGKPSNADDPPPR
jgi:hypothetical protein